MVVHSSIGYEFLRRQKIMRERCWLEHVQLMQSFKTRHNAIVYKFCRMSIELWAAVGESF